MQLVISDAHPGLKRAITEVFVGAAWQRCRVHFMRNLLARVPKKAQAMVAAAVRPIFQQPDRTAAQRQLREVCKASAGAVPARGGPPRGGGRGDLHLLRLPGRAPAPDLQHQPAGAAEQGTQAAQRRRGDLPESGGGDPAAWAPCWWSRTTSGWWGATTSARPPCTSCSTRRRARPSRCRWRRRRANQQQPGDKPQLPARRRQTTGGSHGGLFHHLTGLYRI